jgi:hypothetical protein
MKGFGERIGPPGRAGLRVCRGGRTGKCGKNLSALHAAERSMGKRGEGYEFSKR